MLRENYSLEKYALYVFAESIMRGIAFEHVGDTERKLSFLEMLGVKKIKIFGFRKHQLLSSKKCDFVSVHNLAFNKMRKVGEYLETYRERFYSESYGKIGRAVKKVGRKLSEEQLDFDFHGAIPESSALMSEEKGYSRADGILGFGKLLK